MTFDLSDCIFQGPALPQPFVRFELSDLLGKLGLLARQHGRTFERNWVVLRRGLRSTGGPQNICKHIIAPLAQHLGFDPPRRHEPVVTREGLEDGGWLMRARDGSRLRTWAFASGTDLDAPNRDGRAYRSSPMRSAQRVLLASHEQMGLMSDGEELRLLLCDPAREGSHVAVPLLGGEGWRSRNTAPDSYRLLLALGSPKGIAALPAILDAARLSQTRVTRDLRTQARQAIEGFLQGLLSNPLNSGELRLDQQVETLWREVLIIVYRLLLILKLESSGDPARSFSFASTDLWRTVLSPNRVLGPLVRRKLDQGHDTGHMLEQGIRVMFRLLRDGLSCSEVSITPLGGALFGPETTPLLDRIAWGERGVAVLLDRLLWTSPKGRARERIHYGSLDVEELGHIYEALLELEPGVATVPMVRLRRAKLDIVVTAEQAERHRNASHATTQTSRIEDINPGQFYLRAGLGRKLSGSYYTPHPFVRFLVREAIAPHIAWSSPETDPNPAAILALRVVDPAMGSGHFLVEACRFLARALYDTCCKCDELARLAEEAVTTAPEEEAKRLLMRAAEFRRRIADLSGSNGQLCAYLPSRANEGGSGISQSRALAICRRLVAVHCLYGVDSNPLAVELAKISLWLESYAEGLPLTFLDHRLVVGDSISGAFFASLMTMPVTRTALDPLLAHDVGARMNETLQTALQEVAALEATVGSDAADLVLKADAKERLEVALRPLRLLAQAWSGAVMLGQRNSDDEWLVLATAVAATGTWPAVTTAHQSALLAVGKRALPWDLVFPEVFYPDGDADRRGFDVVLSNPPWDIVQPNSDEFLAGFDLSVLDAHTSRDARAIRARVLTEPNVARAWSDYRERFVRQHRIVHRLYRHQKTATDGTIMGGKLDLYRVFAERMLEIVGSRGTIGMVMPSAFHANEGATAIRRHYLQHSQVAQCWSFENRHGLFDIHARYRFDLIVAHRPGPTTELRCAFYLDAFQQLEEPHRLLTYSRDFIEASGGRHRTFLELRDDADVTVAQRMFPGKRRIDDLGITLSRELHMTDDAGSFEPLADLGRADPPASTFVLHEGKTIHQFRDRWDTLPRFAINIRSLAKKSLEASRYYRAACREIARSTDERTSIATVLPPGVLCGHTISVERAPMRRTNATALTLVSIMNSFPFDWIVRQKVGVHVSIYILLELPLPMLLAEADAFLAHGCLRLCCNDTAFAPLWRDQLGKAWFEIGPAHSWPAMPAESDRWQLRATMDAVVAHGYALTRTDYERILGSFSHKSFAAAPALCLAAFDELANSGLKAFCRRHDPYCDVPLVTTLAQPIIDLPLAHSQCGGAGAKPIR